MPLLRRDLAIDLGTTAARVWERGRGRVAAEPSVVARDLRTGAVVAMGTAARTAVEERAGAVVAEPVLVGGAVVDHATAARFLQLLLVGLPGLRVGRLRVGMVVPVTLTGVERRAVAEVARSAGVSSVTLLDAPLAGAIGAGLAVGEPSPSVVVDTGAGVTQAAVVSLGGIVTSAGARVGGLALDAALRAHVRDRHGVVLGDRAVEALKLCSATAAVVQPEAAAAEVTGRDLDSGAAATVRVGAAELREAIERPVGAIVGVVTRVLASCPPELVRDLPETGLHLVGGGALLTGLAARVAEAVGVPVTVAAEPGTAVVRGAPAVLELSPAGGSAEPSLPRSGR